MRARTAGGDGGAGPQSRPAKRAGEAVRRSGTAKRHAQRGTRNAARATRYGNAVRQRGARNGDDAIAKAG